MSQQTINDRILLCIKELGLTKTAFAEKLNITQPYVSQICAGKKTPSDRTIADICREFDINEHWLRTGEGEMVPVKTRDQRIAEFIGETLRDEDDSFKKRLISMLSKLDTNEWEVLAKVAQKLVGEMEEG